MDHGTLVVNYEVDRRDLKAFGSKLPRGAGWRGAGPLLGTLLLTYLPGGAALALFGYWLVLLASAGVIAIAVAFLMAIAWRADVRRRREFRRQLTTRISPQGFHTAGPDGWEHVVWRRVLKVESWPELIALFVDEHQAIVIPARAFTAPQERDAFVTACRDFHAAARGQPEPQTLPPAPPGRLSAEALFSDHEAALLLQHADSGSWFTQLVNWTVVGVAVGILVVLARATPWMQFPLGLMFVCVSPGFLWLRIHRFLLAMQPGSPPQPVRWVLTGEGLLWQRPGREGLCPWRRIRKIQERAQCLALEVEFAQHAAVIPWRAFPSAEARAEFILGVHDAVAAAHADPALPSDAILAADDGNPYLPPAVR